jgi:hypothetical protein
MRSRPLPAPYLRFMDNDANLKVRRRRGKERKRALNKAEVFII